MRILLLAVVAALGLAKPFEHGTRKVKEQLPNKLRGRELAVEPRRLIVGGTPVPANTYPFFGTLGVAGCGATLIYEDIALTAASCSYSLGDLTLGITKLGVSGIPIGGEYQAIEYGVFFSEYTGLDSSNDIMLLKLESPVNDAVPVALATSGPDQGDVVTLVGFGSTSAAGYLSRTLMQVDLPVVSNICTNFYGIADDSSIFCAGGTGATGKDACYGDTGGPVFNAAGEQVGIISFAFNCSNASDIPGAYTRVSAYADWIKARICEMSANPPSDCPPPSTPPAGSVEVVVDIFYDSFPSETRWNIFDLDGVVVMSSSGFTPGSITSASVPVSLIPGEYIFQMTDSAGDGLYNGNVTISSITEGANNTVAFSNGQFGNSLTLPFSTDGSSTDPPEGLLAKLQVNLTYNDFDYVTYWSLSDSDNLTVASGPRYEEIYNPGETFATEYDLVPGVYTFIIQSFIDNGDNGGNGEGSFTVSVLDADGFATVLTSGGFTDIFEDVITVPRPVRVKCNDTDATFAISSTETRDCGWLKTNLASYPYLCPFADVAAACPSTCGSCARIADLNATNCLDTVGSFVANEVEGSTSCAFLANYTERFAYACDFATVAFRCPETCGFDCSTTL